MVFVVNEWIVVLSLLIAAHSDAGMPKALVSDGHKQSLVNNRLPSFLAQDSPVVRDPAFRFISNM